MKHRVFVSGPDNRHLDARRHGLKRAIIRSIRDLGFEIAGFEPEQFGIDAPANPDAWTVERTQSVLQRCDGIVVLGLARSRVVESEDRNGLPKPLPSPYNHLEGALGLALGVPVLVLSEAGMDRVGIFDSGIKPVEIPTDATEAWVTSTFANYRVEWSRRVNERRDIFLAYCGKGSAVAEDLRTHLENLNYTVLDWSRDFNKAGTTILEEIERAGTMCKAGVFLFTKDDELTERALGETSFDAVPRDNVLLEAGYFMRARGKQRVAIVREAGAKMPVDLGGVIYIQFTKRDDLELAKTSLEQFLKASL